MGFGFSGRGRQIALAVLQIPLIGKRRQCAAGNLRRDAVRDCRHVIGSGPADQNANRNQKSPSTCGRSRLYRSSRFNDDLGQARFEVRGRERSCRCQKQA